MDKYKIVGIIDIILGTLLIILPVFSSTITSSTTSTFNELGVSSSSNNWLAVGVIVLIGIVDIFLGIKLFSGSKSDKNKYFTAGIILAILSVLASGFYSSTVVSSILAPVNSLYTK